MPFLYPDFLEQLAAIRPDHINSNVMAVETKARLECLEREDTPMNESEERLFRDIIVVGFPFSILRYVATAFGHCPVEGRAKLVGDDAGMLRLLNAILTKVFPVIGKKFSPADFPELRDDPVGIMTGWDLTNYKILTLVGNPRDPDFRRADIERLVRAFIDVYDEFYNSYRDSYKEGLLLIDYLKLLVLPEDNTYRKAFFAKFSIALAKKMAIVDVSVVSDPREEDVPSWPWPLSFFLNKRSSSPGGSPAAISADSRRLSGGSVAPSSPGAASGGSSSARLAGSGLESWLGIGKVAGSGGAAAMGGAGAPALDDIAL